MFLRLAFDVCAHLCVHVGERLGMVEAQCERLRMLYRDCARPPPPPPPLQIDRRQVGDSCFDRLEIEHN